MMRTSMLVGGLLLAAVVSTTSVQAGGPCYGGGYSSGRVVYGYAPPVRVIQPVVPVYRPPYVPLARPYYAAPRVSVGIGIGNGFGPYGGFAPYYGYRRW